MGSRGIQKRKRRVRAKYETAGHRLTGFHKVPDTETWGAICKLCRGVVALTPDGTVQNYGLESHHKELSNG